MRWIPYIADGCAIARTIASGVFERLAESLQSGKQLSS